MAKVFFESTYFFPKIFVRINFMFFAFALIVGFLWELFH